MKKPKTLVQVFKEENTTPDDLKLRDNIGHCTTCGDEIDYYHQDRKFENNCKEVCLPCWVKPLMKGVQEWERQKKQGKVVLK